MAFQVQERSGLQVKLLNNYYKNWSFAKDLRDFVPRNFPTAVILTFADYILYIFRIACSLLVSRRPPFFIHLLYTKYLLKNILRLYTKMDICLINAMRKRRKSTYFMYCVLLKLISRGEDRRGWSRGETPGTHFILKGSFIFLGWGGAGRAC